MLNLFRSNDPSYENILTCGLKPLILFINSDLKPFITDITTIRTATPKVIPINEKVEIMLMNPSFFFVNRYRYAIFLSSKVINLTFYF